LHPSSDGIPPGCGFFFFDCPVVSLVPHSTTG
jgi:hypothetical protein